MLISNAFLKSRCILVTDVGVNGKNVYYISGRHARECQYTNEAVSIWCPCSPGYSWAFPVSLSSWMAVVSYSDCSRD